MVAIEKINPFRYRGYYYDTETGFYYLQTRYYDPETMRFINADNYELVGALSCVPGQLNLYAYANNNPIMYTDETGEGVLSGILTQLTVSTTFYLMFSLSAIFDENIKNDMNAIAWNPFNSNESLVVQSNTVSFYKGVPVVQIIGMGGSLSLGAIFFDKSQGAETLKHERGHNTQLMSMGLGDFLIQIGIPSVLKNGDETPWELSASMLGGSALADDFSEMQKRKARTYHIGAMISIANIYNIFSVAFIY